MFRNTWVRVGLMIFVAAVLVGVVSFFGAAWGSGQTQPVTKPTAVPSSSAPTNLVPTPQPAPVTVIVNPPTVNVTVIQTVNGIATEGWSSWQNAPSYPYLSEFEGLVYSGNFNEYKGVIKESVIDHAWGSYGPFGLTRFSIKWRGSVVVSESGRYRFSVLSDDRVRLEVGDQYLIDKWISGQPATEYTAEVNLAAGAHKIILKYFNDVVGDSRIRLSCQRIY